jgi:hypothetical protein
MHKRGWTGYWLSSLLGVSACMASPAELQLEASEAAAGESAALSGVVGRWAVRGSLATYTDMFFPLAINGDGLVMVVGAYTEDSNGVGVNSGAAASDARENSGAAYVFVRGGPNRPWAQEAYLKASNPSTTDYFGSAVAINADGTVLAVSNGGNSGSRGVYVFRLGQNGWAEEAFVSLPNASGDLFASKIALNRAGTVLAVNASGKDSFTGIVHVFRKTQGWAREASITASNANTGDAFGSSIALDGEGGLLAVGATSEDSSAVGVNGNQADNTASGSGAVYLFAATNAVWTQTAYIKASNTGAGDAFGRAVSLSSDGSTLAVGASGEDSEARGVNGDQSSNRFLGAGAVYVLRNEGGSWRQQSYLKAGNADMGDAFGSQVALNDDATTLVVSATGEASCTTMANGDGSNNDCPNTGAAYVFTGTSGGWSQQYYLKSDVPNGAMEFGRSVATSGDGNVIAVGTLPRGATMTERAFVFSAL